MLSEELLFVIELLGGLEIDNELGGIISLTHVKEVPAEYKFEGLFCLIIKL
jgi:hypothetical protein